MATIASIAVKLIADPTKFVGGLKIAENAMKKVGKSGLNPGVWAKLASTGFGKIQSAIDGIVGPIKGLIGQLPLVGGALASIPTSVGGVMGWFKEGSEIIKDMQKDALRLGIDISRMSGLMMAGGSASDALVLSMFRLSKELGEAAMKAEGTEMTFARLGLNARQLSQVPIDTALGKIADKINKLGNQAARGAAVFSIFGKRGAELMPLLARGSAGLEMFQRKAREMGMTVSAVDATKVKQASLAVKQIDFWVKAAKQNIAIELAPVVSALADQFKGAGVSAKDFANGVKQTGMVVAYMGAYAADGWKMLGHVWDMLLIGVRRMGQGIHKVITWLMEQAAKLPKSLGGEKFKGVAANMRASYAAQLADLKAERERFLKEWNEPGAVASLDKFFSELENRISQQEQALKNAPKGADAEFTRMFELFERGQKVMEESATSAETYSRKMADLNELLRAGAINQATFSRAAGLATMNLHKADELNLGAETPLAKMKDRIDELNQLLKLGAINWETFQRSMGKAIMDGHKADEMMLGLETPLEKLNSTIDMLNMQLDRGTISWEIYSRGVNEAGKSILDLAKAQEMKMSSSQEFGSQEAYATINRTMLNNTDKGSGLANLQDGIKRLIDVQQRQKKDLDDIAKAARNGFLAVGKL